MHAFGDQQNVYDLDTPSPNNTDVGVKYVKIKVEVTVLIQ
ncbi:unnamed protein product [Paramecium octaurelia]|uniref:Uncharacterized protein n=1 Tax=Paramecium octaurelia TaxID=43137 RepID=A0A8S1YK09_PAROT|nr:unnamed protein product [Paramecium octaurelia]